jgi:hypothetical protein
LHPRPLHRAIIFSAAAILTALLATNPAAPIHAATATTESEILPFLGTWTATHSGTPIIVLTIHSANGAVSGTVQVASYNVSEVTGKVDVVTNPTLSAKSPIDAIKISGNSLSFHWKDPDGDTDHWRLDITEFNSGKITWLDLPADAKFQPIPVTKTVAKPK